mmetsp:Transcript_13597/g.37632  ORF Transcript_13597/g.37632 Transcript_13597/m.37632 type:complete len:230 (-) Transcript_13597:56-745(-)|eukprot:CAMPEP_0113689144 /NCGR_PEP_ID=MMETSP0038_2-20120614/16973_1 /TAXON_ID=2898 /ORGANISM="Cryptomonas paramecium" /LENGTH=229 /DNA_ID=CAMNT_0000610127 /DNA_START=167 /DNA_END=856 /DNA_ORIENTATION=- /assembly_acc=CAM_ASM_000170
MEFESSSKRCVLTKKDAVEIFLLKDEDNSHAASVVIAAKYNVSPKAIRDIWSGRSWLKATEKLWNKSDLPKHNPVGRPKGKKDSKPRQLKPCGDRKQHMKETVEPTLPATQKPVEHESFLFDQIAALTSLSKIIAHEEESFGFKTNNASGSLSPLSQLRSCSDIANTILPPLCMATSPSTWTNQPYFDGPLRMERSVFPSNTWSLPCRPCASTLPSLKSIMSLSVDHVI